MTHGVSVQATDRRVKVIKGQLIHGLTQLSAHTAHRPTLVGHQ